MIVQSLKSFNSCIWNWSSSQSFTLMLFDLCLHCRVWFSRWKLWPTNGFWNKFSGSQPAFFFIFYKKSRIEKISEYITQIKDNSVWDFSLDDDTCVYLCIYAMAHRLTYMSTCLCVLGYNKSLLSGGQKCLQASVLCTEHSNVWLPCRRRQSKA